MAKARRSTTRALLLVLLMVGGVVAGAGVQTALATDSEQSEDGDENETDRTIDSCTRITESGVYEVTSDLSSADITCLRIQQIDDVRIDGNGHTITGGNVHPSSASNITVHNLTVQDGRSGINFETVRDGAIRNVTVTNTTATGIVVAIVSPETTIADSNVSDNPGTGVTIRDSTNVVVRNTTVSDNGEAGIKPINSVPNTTIADSTIENNVGAGIDADRSTTGMYLHVRGNVVRNNSVGIATDVLSSEDTTTIHRNVIADNREAGLTGGDSLPEWINATQNYWGAADGPSSHPADDADAPFADPETGVLANGDGDGIAEATDDDLSGIAAARFDPWLAVPALNDAFAGPPRDLDGDGLYEDVNGDGDVNVGDAQALFAFEDSTIVQENAALFDFNEDGDVNVGDAQALFARLTGGNG